MASQAPAKTDDSAADDGQTNSQTSESDGYHCSHCKPANSQ